MASLAIRVSAWNALSERDKTIFRHAGELLRLGVPARYVNPSAVEWFVFDDHRFTAKHIAYFGCLVANISSFPPAYEIPEDKAQLTQDIITFCNNHGVVLPKDVVFPPDDPNPWQTLLDAQGTPSAVQMALGVPDTWTPVTVEP
jgi:hypothetical protein